MSTEVSAQYVASIIRVEEYAYFTLASCLAYSSILKMGATISSETSADFQQNTQRYAPEDITYPISSSSPDYRIACYKRVPVFISSKSNSITYFMVV
jgi:hypothetical protein